MVGTNDKKIKVLYLAGWGRSGSTILSSYIDQIDGFSFLGEIRFLWEHGFIKNILCSCGETIRDCDFWREVLNDAFGKIEKMDALRIIETSKSCTRSRHIPFMIKGKGAIFLGSRFREYLDILEELYLSINKFTGGDIIIDSSKSPMYAFALGMIPTIDLYILHLVRDPRAVAYSWRRKKFDPGRNGLFARLGISRSSIMWNVWNVGVEIVAKTNPKMSKQYLFVRYEDFIENPIRWVNEIRKFLDESIDTSFPLDDQRLFVVPNHNIAANPIRFQKGTIAINADNEWLHKMRPKDKIFVTMMTWPLLLKYGYSLFRELPEKPS
jgi:hypothetical protein